VLIAGICGLVAFAVYGQVAQSRHLDAQVTALAAQNASLVQQISDSEREIADAQTIAWLEQEARQLGYIFPGEHLYQFVPPGRGGAAVGGVSVPVPVFKPPATPSPSPTPSVKPSPTPTPTARPVTVPSPTPTPAPH
jgi:Septum formation initiator